ncbi:fumarate reductase subunit FrdC [Vibrio mangrovi]|uniref:Fumarate reductase subunit C n=1 Tax=Vibrio mangrovi TaxID=474394 RepID=A0A1Y6IZJ9_9VIBR|nr:fumarate reductase subunit FrdC [Vibrio mangrovi]MDW6004412.1 fumarate reductase subunit FrdC [Vibrio mangrovi]SMS03095.1 Fumarate reductase subunit C [Vibrio mangrovi]
MSNRKPYIREVKRTWWKNNPFYRFYMLREGTVIPLIFFTLALTAGLLCLVKGPEAWQSWLNFMANPLVVAINIVALIASLFHAHTFFGMMPQVIPVRIKGKKLSTGIIVLGQWFIVAVISLLALVLI